MAYYDDIARQWHKATGYKGGSFKELVLNDVLLKHLSGIQDAAILELGAGNGYFLPLLLRHFSGQVPASITITDQSGKLLEIASEHFRVPEADYQILDVGRRFPFADERFDLILASMIFNELSTRELRHALAECRRVLARTGLLLIAVTHPDFVNNLRKRRLLSLRGSTLTMPGSGSLRLPVVIRSVESYSASLTEAGFEFEAETVFPTSAVLNVKSGLKQAGRVPLALVLHCQPM